MRDNPTIDKREETADIKIREKFEPQLHLTTTSSKGPTGGFHRQRARERENYLIALIKKPLIIKP